VPIKEKAVLAIVAIAIPLANGTHLKVSANDRWRIGTGPEMVNGYPAGAATQLVFPASASILSRQKSFAK
jgi:hypothetical protein